MDLAFSSTIQALETLSLDFRTHLLHPFADGDQRCSRMPRSGRTADDANPLSYSNSATRRPNIYETSANASRDTQRQCHFGLKACAHRQTHRRALAADLSDEMVGKPDGEGDGGKRGVGLSGCRENAATGDIEVGDVDDAAVLIDDGVLAVNAHLGQTDLMVAVFRLRIDMLFKLFGRCIEYQLADFALLEPPIESEMRLERAANILRQISE